MKIALDNPNPEMGQDEIDKVTVNNVKKLRETINKTGAEILKTISSTTTVSVSSVADTKLEAFQTVVTTSGGLVEFIFQSGADMAIGNGTIKLWIDDLVKLVIPVGGASQQRVMLNMYYAEKLAAGKHKFYITASTGGGAVFTFGFANPGVATGTTLLIIKETVL